MPGHLRHTACSCRSTGSLRAGAGAAGAVALALALGGCAGRGTVEDGAAGDAATAFLAAVSTAPEGACGLLAPATLEVLRSDGEDCAAALAEVAPDVVARAEPTVEVYGRDAIVRWESETVFLARFDDGWLVTAAGCRPRGEDLPYDCSVEGR